MANTCCIPRLTAAMAIQQHKPIKMGLPPVRTSLTMFVFSPMAPIAMMMKNLESSLKGWNTEDGTPTEVATVVIMDANTKNKMKNGNTFFRENVFSWVVPIRLALAVRHRANTNVMGIMARVRVSFTMVAWSRVLAPG